jgi:SAM-dependent methyltransferase
MQKTTENIANDREQHLLARTLITQGKLADAADILSALVLAETPLFDPYYELACLAVRENEVETATQLFTIALEKAPESVFTRRNLALMQSIGHQYEDALATLSPVLRSAHVSNEDYCLVRAILGKAPELSSIAWARLIVDLRSRDVAAQELIKKGASPSHGCSQLLPENERLKTTTPTIGSIENATDADQFLAELGYLAANGLTGFKWFFSKKEYFDWDREISRVQGSIERYIIGHKTISGYCELCEKPTVFSVSSGIQIEGHTHLREGMICTTCRIHNRGRVLGLAIKNFVSYRGDRSDILLMEATTPLYDHLHAWLPILVGTEFQSPSIAGGTIVNIGERQVRHESILNLSFPDQSLDLVTHADLLEHVPDVNVALRECFRVLRQGGELIFSVPFGQTRDCSQKRAELRPSGEINDFLPKEFHGSHLVYYNYGWDLLDFCRAAGFSEVRIGVLFDPLQGLLSTGRFGSYFMQPIIFSCIR